jgi:hypothetical protein
MAAGWDNTFASGGIWWSKVSPHPSQSGQVPYKNAIANELFMAVAARLYLRRAGGAPAFPGTNDASYKTWAVNEANWFIDSGLIRTDQTPPTPGNFPGTPNLINDSLNEKGFNDGTTLGSDGKWHGAAFWTYNHGVLLRALCDVSTITGDPHYRARAEQVADAAIGFFIDAEGILTELWCGLTCDIGTCQFKGVFIRNLAALFANDQHPNYRTFVTNNATAVLANGNASSQFGQRWDHSPDAVDFVRQTAAIDALNAANRVLAAQAPISLKNTLALAGQPMDVRKAIGGLTSSVRGWVAALTT